MKLILREDVYNLGKSGEVVSVKDGFGRNFLLPRKMAALANEQNVRRLQHEKSVIEARQQKLKGAAEEEGKKIAGASVKITRKVGDQDKLFGSVTASDIAHQLEAQGYHIEKRQIDLHEPIRALGVYRVPIRLHADVHPEIKVWVIKA